MRNNPICIDFDGTIVEHDYPRVGAPVPYAIEALKDFMTVGAHLILWTLRHGEVLQDAVDYCEGNGIVLWGVNENPDQIKWSKSRKVYAPLYIDDAAFGCPLIHPGAPRRPYVDWTKIHLPVMEMLEK